jgi:hypothetical protein
MAPNSILGRSSMRSHLPGSLSARSGALLALFASSCIVACGGSDVNIETPPGDDTGLADGGDSSIDSSIDTSTPVDTATPDDTATPTDTSDTATPTDTGDGGGGETSGDTAVGDTAVGDIGDTAVSDTTTGETGADSTSTDTGPTDTGPIDTGVDTTPACTGALCPDRTLCVSGTCTPCTTDTACSTAVAGTLCVGGKCLAGTCKPKVGTTPPTGCTAPATCCASTTATACLSSTVTGATSCCDDTDCSGKTSHCDTTAHACVCPAPVAGEWRVASTGSDTEGPTTANGSAACPFKTITKAIAKTVGLTTPQTIIVTATATYGTTCTGGAPCDVTPIRVPDTVPAGSIITGNGTGPDVIVQGDTVAPTPGGMSAVFIVAAKGISFKTMTIKPQYAVAGGGAHGIVFTGPLNAGGAEGTISNVTITGINTGTTATGNGLWFNGSGTSPTVGPGVTITGGIHAIYEQGGTSAVTITGTTAAPSLFSGTNQSCVRADSASTTTAPALKFTTGTVATPTVTVRDCGGYGGIVLDTVFAGTPSSVDRVTIFRGVSGGGFDGIHILNQAVMSVSNSSITGLGGSGMVAEGGAGTSAGSNLTVDTCTVTGHAAQGVRVSGNSKATLTALTGTGNALDNVRCTDNATVKLRSSVLTGSTGGAGLRLSGTCTADLGTSTGAGSNTFNKTSAKNNQSGICVTATTVPATTATSSTWSCDYSPSGCTPATVSLKPTVTVACGASDIGGVGASAVTAALPQTCCF